MEKKKIEIIKKTQTKKGVQTISYYYIANAITKREHFAGLAMQGLLSNSSQTDTTDFEWVAKHAVGYADALIEELNKTN